MTFYPPFFLGQAPAAPSPFQEMFSSYILPLIISIIIIYIIQKNQVKKREELKKNFKKDSNTRETESSNRKENWNEKLRNEKLRNEKEDSERQSRKESEVDRRKSIVFDVINNIYKNTAREVNKSLISTLINELYDIHILLHSVNLNEIIINGSHTEFQNIINALISELHRLKEQALYAQSKGYSDKVPNDIRIMSKERAFEILGVKDTVTKAELKKAYRDLVKKYNTDQRGDLEEHIKQMLEEKMKEINNARDYLSDLDLI